MNDTYLLMATGAVLTYARVRRIMERPAVVHMGSEGGIAMDNWIDQMIEVSRALDNPTTSAVYEDSPFYFYHLCRDDIEALVPPKPWIEEKIYLTATRKAFLQPFFVGSESHGVSVSICDDPRTLASGFCSKHDLSALFCSMVLELVEQGRDALRFHYRPLVFDFSLNDSPVQIRMYPGDDPSLLAERFCKERGLDGENCQMLHDFLRTKSFPKLLTYDSLCPKSTSTLKKEIYRELVVVDDRPQMLEFVREDDPAQATERFLSQFSIATSGKEGLMNFVETTMSNS